LFGSYARLQACRAFINTNSVTKVSKTSRSPELLAKYCDGLLKKSSKNPPEDQLEQILTEVMVIFNVCRSFTSEAVSPSHVACAVLGRQGRL
jgi:hypothetical protein